MAREMIAEINQTEKWDYSAEWQRGMPHGNQMTYNGVMERDCPNRELDDP